MVIVLKKKRKKEKKKKSPLHFIDISIKNEMTNMLGKEWFEVIFELFLHFCFSFENVGEVNYGMTAAYDLKWVLLFPFLLLK